MTGEERGYIVLISLLVDSFRKEFVELGINGVFIRK